MTDLTTMVEVHLKNEDDFLKVKETLTRIGDAYRKDRKIYHCLLWMVNHLTSMRMKQTLQDATRLLIYWSSGIWSRLLMQARLQNHRHL